MTTIRDLEKPCHMEGCTVGLIGDHTMREWNAHLEQPTDMLDYEEDPLASTSAMFATAGLAEGTVIADHVVAKSAVFDAATGIAPVRVPLLLLDFAFGRPGLPPLEVAKVAVVSSPAIMRQLGTMLHDTAWGAARAASA